MTEQQLYDSFVTRLQTVSNLPPLQQENTRVILKGEVPYVSAVLLRARPTQLTIGHTGKDRHQGIFQVSVHVPTDTGTTAANALVDSITAAFPRGAIIGSTDAEGARVRLAYRHTAQRLNDQFHVIPISIEWALNRTA